MEQNLAPMEGQTAGAGLSDLKWKEILVLIQAQDLRVLGFAKVRATFNSGQMPR